MIDAIKAVYGRAGRYALLCPLLFLVPVAFEIAQHVIELQLGLYRSREAMIAAEAAPARMVMGHFKVIALFLTGYWAMRFVAFGNDPVAARTVDGKAVRLFLPVMAWGLLWLVLLQDGPLLAAELDWPKRAVSIGLLATFFVTFLFEPCLAAWKTAAPVGNGRIGFVRSIRLMRGNYLWALGLSLLIVMPLMVIHYGLAFAALGRSPLMSWSIMAVDSALAGFMGAAMTITNYVIARRVTDAHSIELMPESLPAADRRVSLPIALNVIR